ncbi:MAG: GreA/GreB family elongation factor [Verrucomicrobiota bacterium]
MDSETIDQLIAGDSKLESSRAKLEAMQPGAYCIHRSWGFGKIQSYDADANKLIIDFEEGKEGHAMDPAFCVDKLDVLAPDDILVRKRTEGEAVDEMIDKDRVGVVISILGSKEDRQATAIEIERQLAFLIPQDRKRKKWWTDTKKDLIREPRVAVPSKKTDPFVLREEEITPEEEILEEFFATKKAKQKILLAEKLYALSKDKTELKEHLESVLETLTRAIKDTKLLTHADRLHGVWVRNDLARDDSTDMDVETLEPTSFSIIEESAENFEKLADELPAAYYHRFLDLLTRTYPDKWEDIIVRLLRHSEGKFTSECIAFLYEKKKEARVQDCFERWLNEQTMRGPILQWIIKNRNSQKYSELIDGLLSPRLLNAVFYAIDLESLQNASTRRIPLADALSDDTELIPLLLDRGTAETARDLAQTLLLNQGFDDLTKKSLLVRFIRKYPSIQSLLEREAEAETDAGADAALTVSQDSFDAAKREYEELVGVKIPENKQAIETAKEHGDLRENAEYKMARQDQDTLLARKADLDRDLARARVTDFSDASADSVGIGSVVELLEGSSGKTRKYAILGAWDSDPDRNVLSYLTPLGQMLLAKEVGDVVETEVDGIREEWKVESLARWVDQSW